MPRGCRGAVSEHRLYAYRGGSIRRQKLEAARRQMAERGPIAGDMVYIGSCGSEGKLLEVGEDGSCSIEFSLGEISEVKQYKTMGVTKETRNLPGSARLRQVLPLLSPPDRKPARTSDALNGLAQRVEEHVRTRCSESPHTRDEMSRRVAVCFHEKKQPRC